MMRQIVLSAICLALLAGCGNKGIQPGTPVLSVFTAAGMRHVSMDICTSFSKDGEFVVEHNFASSGTLARQIASGARADVLISASYKWILFLEEKGFINGSDVYRIAGNSLVVVCDEGKETQPPVFEPGYNPLEHLDGPIAMGDPAYVPVGTYTKMVFDTLGWTGIMKQHTILGKDVSSVLHYAESGACEWAVVYRSEAMLSDRVRIIAEIPEELHEPVEFYMALLKGGKGRELTGRFTDEEGLEILRKYGFKIPGDD